MPFARGALRGRCASPPDPRGRCGCNPPHCRRRPGEEPLPQPRPPVRSQTRKTRSGSWERAPARPGPAMQTLEVGPVPAPTREPRLTRWLRRGSGILAHLVALGFTIFLTVLSRPGTSECAGRGGAREGGGAEMLEGQLLGTLGDVEWGPQQWKGGPWKGSKGVVGRSSGAGSWKALGAGEERQTTGLTSAS